MRSTQKRDSLHEMRWSICIACHHICPAEIAEDLSIVWHGDIRFTESLYSTVELSLRSRDAAIEISACTRVWVELTSDSEDFICLLDVTTEYMYIRELLVETIVICIVTKSLEREYLSSLIVLIGLHALYLSYECVYILYLHRYSI